MEGTGWKARHTTGQLVRSTGWNPECTYDPDRLVHCHVFSERAQRVAANQSEREQRPICIQAGVATPLDELLDMRRAECEEAALAAAKDASLREEASDRRTERGPPGQSEIGSQADEG